MQRVPPNGPVLPAKRACYEDQGPDAFTDPNRHPGSVRYDRDWAARVVQHGMND